MCTSRSPHAHNEYFQRKINNDNDNINSHMDDNRLEKLTEETYHQRRLIRDPDACKGVSMPPVREDNTELCSESKSGHEYSCHLEIRDNK